MKNYSELGEAMTYEITMEDIDAYLATKQDEEEIGITAKARECLIARAFQHKYPGHDIGIAIGEVVIDGAWQPLSTDIHMLYCQFDEISHGQIERPITKREWMEAQS